MTAFLTAIATFASSPAAAQPAPPRTEVPIRQVRLSDGTVRYAVPVAIAGRDMLVGLDTGSTGLRLLPAATPAAVEPTGRPARVAFGSGVVLTGDVVRVPIAIGGRSGTIGAQRVTAIGCRGGRGCGADLGIEAFRILGDGLPGEGFVALIGLRTVPDAAPRNPLLQLGVRRWIVSLPVPGSPAPGRLVVDPGPRELAGFRAIPRGPDAGQTIACLLRPTPRPSRACGATMIDTGAPGLTVAGAGMPDVARPGAPARLVFGERGPALELRLDDRAQMTRFRSVAGGGSGPVIRAGVTPYLAFDILYDADGSIAVRPRAPYPGGPVVLP